MITERRQIQEHDDPWVGHAVEKRVASHRVADRRPGRHRQKERRRDTGKRDAERREQRPRRGLGAHCREHRHRAREQPRIAEMRGDLPQTNECEERDETQSPRVIRPLPDRRRGRVSSSVASPTSSLAADLRQPAVEDARVRGLLGDGPLRHAFEVALAVDCERRVVLQAEPRLDRRPGARILAPGFCAPRPTRRKSA